MRGLLHDHDLRPSLRCGSCGSLSPHAATDDQDVPPYWEPEFSDCHWETSFGFDRSSRGLLCELDSMESTRETDWRARRAMSTGGRVSHSDSTGASTLIGIPAGIAASISTSGNSPSHGSRRMARPSSWAPGESVPWQ